MSDFFESLKQMPKKKQIEELTDLTLLIILGPKKFFQYKIKERENDD